MKNKTYFTDKTELKELYKLSQEIHGNMSLIKMFCKNYEEIDYFYQIIPLINRTNLLTDELFSHFVNMNQ